MAHKLFGTDGIRGKANVFPLQPDYVTKLATVAGALICTEKKRAAIAKDTRISSDMLEAALIAGFTSQGVDVIRLGVIPTPAVTMLTSELNVDMSVMITASHNPYQDNGIKLIAGDGNKFSDAVTSELEAAVEKAAFTYNPEKIGRVIDSPEEINRYKKLAMTTVSGAQALKGLKVVLDCANGCFSKLLPEVFAELGAETVILSNCPDGYNVNRGCGSQHVENMLTAVQGSGADMGIAVDGDGDRIIVADDEGKKINSEQVIAFLACYLASEGKLNGRPVVSTVLSNTALERYIKSLGVDYYSTKVGERYVVEKMNEVNGCVGGEESGHVVVADYCKSGDALMVALVLAQALAKSGRRLSEIFPLFEFDPFVFVNPRFETQEKVREIMGNAEVKEAIDKACRALEGKGRVVVRASGTEPLIRVWLAGEDEAQVKQASDEILEKIEKLR